MISGMISCLSNMIPCLSYMILSCFIIYCYDILYHIWYQIWFDMISYMTTFIMHDIIHALKWYHVWYHVVRYIWLWCLLLTSGLPEKLWERHVPSVRLARPGNSVSLHQNWRGLAATASSQYVHRAMETPSPGLYLSLRLKGSGSSVSARAGPGRQRRGSIAAAAAGAAKGGGGEHGTLRYDTSFIYHIIVHIIPMISYVYYELHTS